MQNKINSKKGIIIIIVCLLSFTGLRIWRYYSRVEIPSDKEQLILNKLDSLDRVEKQQTIIRDSLKMVIDTNTITIKEIHKTYEKTVNTVTNQSTSADWEFLKNYLSRYYLDSTGLKKIRSDSSTAQ